MKHLFFILAISLCLTSNAQNLKEKAKVLKKENKDQIEMLKKTNNFRDVGIKVPNDNFWYYEVTKHDDSLGKVTGVLNRDGQEVISAKYKTIAYYPELNEGNAPIPRYNALLKVKYPDYLLHHKASPAAFVATSNEKIDIYNIDGTLLQSYNANSYNYLPGYFVIEAKVIDNFCHQSSFFEIANAKALVDQSGRELASDFVAFRFNLKNKLCEYYKLNENGVKLEGIVSLTNPKNDIPCEFHNIIRDGEKGWKVMRTKSSNWEFYDPLVSYDQSRYADKGEEYFDRQMYEEVIEFYKQPGNATSNGKYLTARALYEMANKQINKIPYFCSDVEKGIFFIVNNNVYKNETFDLDLANDLAKTSCELFESYIQEDTTNIDQSSFYLMVTKQMINEKIPNLRTRYENACKKIGDYNQQRQLEISAALARFVTGVTTNLIEKPASPYKNNVSSNTYTEKNNVSQNDASPSNNRELNDKVLNRIRQVENNIKKEQEYLLNAEERYKSNPTPMEKRVIEAHKRAIENYKKQIEELRK